MNKKDVKNIISEVVSETLKIRNKEIYELNEKIKLSELLHEGLLFTYPIESTVRHLIANGLKKEQITNQVENDSDVMYITIKPEIALFEFLNKKMDVYGWYFNSAVTLIDNKTYKDIAEAVKNAGNKSIDLAFTAKFDIELEDIPNMLYHVTTSSRYEKIKQVGLIPKTKSKLNNHPDRIYLFKTYNKQHVDELIKHLFKTEIVKYEYKNQYVILAINTLNFGVRFFNDPDSHNACYTLENIPHSVIMLMKKINLDEEGNIVNYLAAS